MSNTLRPSSAAILLFTLVVITASSTATPVFCPVEAHPSVTETSTAEDNAKTLFRIEFILALLHFSFCRTRRRMVADFQ